MKLKTRGARDDGWTHATCGSCGAVQPRSEFYEKNTSRCKPCNRKSPSRRAAEVLYRKRHRDVCHERTRDYKMRSKYGIDCKVFDDMMVAQGNLCAICRNPEISKFRGTLRRLNVDHDHDTLKARGLLCNRCNHALDRFDHKPGMLEAFGRYLDQYGQPQGSGYRLPGEPFGYVPAVGSPGLW